MAGRPRANAPAVDRPPGSADAAGAAPETTGCDPQRLRACLSGAAQNSEVPGGTNGPSTGAPPFTIARDRRSAAGPVASDLAVVGPVSRDRPRDCSPSRFGSECQPPRAGFRMDVRNDLHKGLVHKRALRHPDLSTNIGSRLRSVEKPLGRRLPNTRCAATGRNQVAPPRSSDRVGGFRSFGGVIAPT
jgi:hypothetical protein